MTIPVQQSHSNYLPTLDGWRAIAISLVMFSHGFDALREAFDWLGPYKTESMKGLGLLGVQVFFGLSGFLITSRLLSEEQRHGSISLRQFYARRVFRILPASLVFLMAVALMTWAGLLPITWGRWLDTLLFMANYTSAEHSWYLAHFWSLAVEEHFYMVWPLLFLVLRGGKRRLGTAIALAIGVAVWRAVDFKWQITGMDSARFWGRTDIQADAILCGVIAALLYADAQWRLRLERLLKSGIAAPMLMLMIAGVQVLPELNWKISFALISIKAILIPLALLATQLQCRRWPGRLLESRPLVIVGHLSFSLYLWQQLFLVWSEYRADALGIVQLFPWNLLALGLCASLSYMWVERPMIAVGQRLLSQLRKRGARGSGAADIPVSASIAR